MAVVHYSQDHQLQNPQTLIYNQSFNNFTNSSSMTQLPSPGFSFLTDSDLSSLEQQHEQHNQQMLSQAQLQQMVHQQPPAPCDSPADSCGSGNLSSGNQRSSLTLATGRRNLKAEKVTPEEERRRAMRREKNRRAAAKCRQKRQECIASLEEEVQELEHDRNETEQQLQRLQQEAHQLLSLLELHSGKCRYVSNQHFSQANTETVVSAAATSDEKFAQLISLPSLSPTRLQLLQRQRPNDLVLRTLKTRTSLETDGVVSPSSAFQSSPLPSVTASWETGGLGLTPLLSSLEASKNNSTSFPCLVEIKTENDYASL